MRELHGNRRGVSAFLGLWLLFLGWAVPSASVAAETGWPLSHDAGVALGFGAAYVGTEGKTAAHRGVDIVGNPDDEVLAPSSGEVRFVGRIPAMGGGTQLAATILRPDGVSLTFMPLLNACVSTGDAISVGQRIAGLAAEGDISSSGVHLHVGARRGDLYIDPMQFLAAPPATVTESPAAEAPAPETVEQASAAVPAAGSAMAPTPAATFAESPVDSVAGEAGTEIEPAGQAVAADAEVRSQSAAADALSAPGAVGELTSAGTALLAAGAGSLFGPPAATPLAPGTVGASTPAVGTPTILAALSPDAGTDPVMAVLTGNAALTASGPAIAAKSSRELPVQEIRLPSAASVASAVRRVGHAWLLALLGSLAGAGALWPLWRRSDQPHEDELRCCIAPEGTQVAAAAGR